MDIEIRNEKTNLLDNLKNLHGKVGKVGWFKGLQYVEGKHPFVAQIAAQNEKGAMRIPARPFFTPTIKRRQSGWQQIIRDGVKKVVAGEQTIAWVMQAVTQEAKGDIRKTIADLREPPLSPFTIKRRLEKRKNKKFVGELTKPLIDTGLMFASIDNTVENEQ